MIDQHKFNTDKFDLGYWDYLYDCFLGTIIPPDTILEIGVYNGGSLLLWNHIFPNCQIYGVDINYCNNIDNIANIKQITGDAYSDSISSMFNNNSIDLIIDDGPHTFDSFKYLVDSYYSKLTSNGIMVIEDVITKETSIKLSTLLDSKNIPYKIINMAGKQKTDKLLNQWKNHLDVFVLWRNNAPICV